MNEFRDKLAADIIAKVIATAQDLGSLTRDERLAIFKLVAEIAFDMADVADAERK